jgi:hypothetical protein
MNSVSSTKLFSDLRKSTRRVQSMLFKWETRQFVRDKIFRELMLNMIDPKKELGLWFEAIYFDIAERQVLDLGPYSYVASLDIADYPVIRNLTSLSNLQRLYIRNCSMYLDMELLTSIPLELELKSCPHLVNFQNILAVKSLKLTYCDATDYKGCERATVLWIESCNIKDVSTFGNIPSLHLRYCNLLEDVNCLTGNERLVLEHCSSTPEIYLKLTDKCKSYRINLINLEKLSIEGEIDDLYVSAYNMNQFDVKGTATQLELFNCNRLEKFSGFAEAVIHLKISKTRVTEISNFSRLQTVKQLWAYQNAGMKKIANCPELEDVELDTPVQLILLENLPKCKTITPKSETTVVRNCPLLWV